jgi:predicted RNA-binding Zn-ribbon protein involved in translation (DUF1610 family)
MTPQKQPPMDIGIFKWYTLDLVRGDQDTSFACPSCGTRSGFSRAEASRKDPQATGQLRPVGHTVRLTSAFPLYFDRIHEPQPLMRGLFVLIGIATVIFLVWFWRQTIFEGGPVPWWGGALALIGGWAVANYGQTAISPRLPLWRFDCPKCGAAYVLATNGTQGRVGDEKGRITGGSTPGSQTH